MTGVPEFLAFFAAKFVMGASTYFTGAAGVYEWIELDSS
jgi:hypothetical protein